VKGLAGRLVTRRQEWHRGHRRRNTTDFDSSGSAASTPSSRFFVIQSRHFPLRLSRYRRAPAPAVAGACVHMSAGVTNRSGRSMLPLLQQNGIFDGNDTDTLLREIAEKSSIRTFVEAVRCKLRSRGAVSDERAHFSRYRSGRVSRSASWPIMSLHSRWGSRSADWHLHFEARTEN
jgi:hypothetical protein